MDDASLTEVGDDGAQGEAGRVGLQRHVLNRPARTYVGAYRGVGAEIAGREFAETIIPRPHKAGASCEGEDLDTSAPCKIPVASMCDHMRIRRYVERLT